MADREAKHMTGTAQSGTDVTSHQMLHAPQQKNQQIRVLHLEDNPYDVELIQTLIRQAGIELSGDVVSREADFRNCLRQGSYDLILADYQIPGYNGLAALGVARELAGALPFIFVSGTLGEEEAIDCLLHGATDYVLKQRLGRLIPAIRRAIAEAAEKKRRRQAESVARLQVQALEAAANAIAITDKKGSIIWTNTAFEELTGFPIQEAKGRDMQSLGKPDPEQLRRIDETIREGRIWRGELLTCRKNGAAYTEQQTITPIMSPTGKITNFVVIKDDITERKQMEAEMIRLALYDELTGLMNRTYFINHLNLALVHLHRRNDSYRFALLYIDLDRFKVVNEGLGHETGDRLLRAGAERLKTCLRPGDVVCRLGGDEFAVILYDLRLPEDALIVTERILYQLELPYEMNHHVIHVTASVGITFSADHYVNADMMLRDADTAVNRAKQRKAGTPYAIFDEVMHAQAFRRFQLEVDLRRHLEARDESVHQVYQPIVDLRTGKIESLECLMRWTHSESGPISPLDFIPIAEEIGLIGSLSLRLLRRTCAHLRDWKSRGLRPIRINVNISAHQLLYGDLSRDLGQILDEYEVAPADIVLELTESALIKSAESQGAQLDNLLRDGFRMAIDDFGTGYSSLSYLGTLPVTSLKLDRSFIKELPESAHNRTIVEAVIAMTRNLNIKVTAEGVETEPQAKMLREMGCDLAQGYLFSRPILPEAAFELVQNS
jgi:diguanylate cyclase (GGDEF)-like protein/PAS domain S-box-containing protein